MKKKEFMQEMLKGKGRCVYAVQKDPEKYRDAVMWACRNNLSYDAQSEGTRAWFVYTLVNCYEDTSPFVDAAAEALIKCTTYGNWTAEHLSDLLMYFVSDGSDVAWNAVCEKYDELYKMLIARKTFPSDGVFSARDYFSSLCVELASDKDSFLEIADDIGKLYRRNPLYDGYHFDWLYETKGKKYWPALKKLAEKSENIAWYVKKSQEYEVEVKKRRSEWKGSKLKRRTLEERKEEFLSVYDLCSLEQTVKAIPVELEGDHEWHGVHLDVLGMEDYGMKAPRSLLYHIYEMTYCSCCREYALTQLGKRRGLSDELLLECLYDSNDDIRAYAKRCLKRRNIDIPGER